MADSQLLEFAKQGDIDKFESACLSLCQNGEAPLNDFVRPFQRLERSEHPERVATLAQTVLENTNLEHDPSSALAIARAGLFAAPKSGPLRELVVDLYKKVYTDQAGFSDALEASGLTGERPARAALKLLSVYLDLKPGDTLIGRMDDRAVEVVEIDRASGILTLRRKDRQLTIPAAELAREYDRVDPQDFRVMKQLHPQKLADMIENDPVGLVAGVLHQHGDSMDSDELREELVPRVIEPERWAKWWTGARAQLKRAPHVRVEGRAPIVITLLDEQVSMEQDLRDKFAAQRDPDYWMGVIEGYLKDKAAANEPLDTNVLAECRDEIARYAESIIEWRPSEALACAVLMGRLIEKGMPSSPGAEKLALEILAKAEDPVALIVNLPQDSYWGRVLELMPKARPNEWIDIVAQVLPKAPATQLDNLTEALVASGRTADVQSLVDQAQSKPLEFAEANYWLWKGPRNVQGVNLPSLVSQLRNTLDTWTALGRTAKTQAEQVKQFRNRLRAALALRDHTNLRTAIQELDHSAAITVRRQLERIDGLGDVLRGKALEILRDVHPQLWQKRAAIRNPWEDDRVIYSTQLGIERRLAERDNIENVQMRENAKRIGEAASHGDLSENSEYKFALEERDLLRARLARVNEDLGKARAIDPLGVATDHVGIGTRVKFVNTITRHEIWISFLGPFDSDADKGLYSYLAPLAQKAMGTKLGETVVLTLEGGETPYDVAVIENFFESEQAQAALKTPNSALAL